MGDKPIDVHVNGIKVAEIRIENISPNFRPIDVKDRTFPTPRNTCVDDQGEDITNQKWQKLK